MNFIYKKRHNLSINEDKYISDKRDTDTLRKGIELCNNIETCRGIEVRNNKTSVIANIYKKENAEETDGTDLVATNEADNIYFLEADRNKYISENDLNMSVFNEEEYTDINNEMTDGVDKISYKGIDIFKSPKNIYKLSLHGKHPSKTLLSAVQKDSKCINVLYRLDESQSADKYRFNLDFNKAKFYGVLYTTSSSIDLKSLVDTKIIDNGKYIARQIVFVNIEEEGFFNLSIVFRDSQLCTYFDNKFIKRTWEKSGYYLHSANIKIKPGIHSIINDFSFDTEKLIDKINNVDGEEVVDSLSFIPSYSIGDKEKTTVNLDENIILDEILYLANPLLLTTINNLEDEYFRVNCVGENNIYNLSNDSKCKDIFKNPRFSEELRYAVKQMFIDIDGTENNVNYMTYHTGIKSREIYGDAVDSFIDSIYKEDYEGDYDSIKFIKNRIESYLLNSFSKIGDSEESEGHLTIDLNHILFLIPILSKAGELFNSYSLFTSSINKQCSDVNSHLYKNGFCESLERNILDSKMSSEINKKGAMDNIDRRDFIYCTSFQQSEDYKEGDLTYGFELSPGRCEKTVLSNKSMTDYLLSNKCTDMEGNWTGGKYCISRTTTDRRGKEAKQRKMYYQNIYQSKDKINNMADGKEVESLSEFINYSKGYFLEDIDEGKAYGNIDFLVSDSMAEICSDPIVDSAEQESKLGQICHGLYSEIKLLKDNIKEDNAEYPDVKYAVDSIKSIEKKREVAKCKNSIVNNSFSNSKDCSNMFDTENETNLIMYSSVAYEYCNKNPFSSECLDYYNNILKKNDRKNDIETFYSKESNIINSFYMRSVLFLLAFIVVSLVVVFLRRTNKTTNMIDSNNTTKIA